MEMMQTVDQIVAILDKFEKPIEIALVVVLVMLNRNVKRTSLATSPAPVDTKAAEKEAKEEAKAQEKSKQARKNSLEKEMKSALDVYFSDKAYEDMTEDEQVLYDKAAAYLGGA